MRRIRVARDTETKLDIESLEIRDKIKMRFLISCQDNTNTKIAKIIDLVKIID